MIKEISDKVIKGLKPAIKEAISDHLKTVDSLASLPAVMSLKEAETHTGITVPQLYNYEKDGLISFIRAGKGKGKMKIKKSELMKLLNEKA